MLGEELSEHSQEILDLGYKSWKDSPHPHSEISEAALKDSLPKQLGIIARELKKGEKAEKPAYMWKVSERLDPEARVPQNIPIHEVVQEYRIFVDVVRNWLFDKDIKASFNETSYFFQAVFELTAEAVKRYTKYKSQQVSDERSEYLAGIAHQMRGPITVLTNQLELIEDKLDREEKERLRRNTSRLEFLVNGVLRLERFKAEDLPVFPRSIYPADVLDKILKDHEFLARSKKIDLEVSINRTLRITTDLNLFTDLLGNLVDNAVKYTDKGFVKVEAKVEKKEISFIVEDSGPGISEKKQSELFKIGRSESAGGAGMGLSIVLKAVKALQGKIKMESQKGRGTSFCVTLPKEIKYNNGAAEKD